MSRALILLGFLSALTSVASAQAPIPERRVGVVVYGATPGGIAAAVAAAREGAAVTLLEESSHIGGLSAGGLSHTDFRTYESLGGLWREFMDRVDAHYKTTYGDGSPQQKASMLGGYYEPRVAGMIFRQMLDEAKVEVLTRHRPTGVYIPFTADGRRSLAAVTFTNLADGKPTTLYAGVFIDGTYEGDLMALAGVKYRLGCEAKTEYDESLAFEEANPWVMAINFRVCLSKNAENRLPIPQPAGYDRVHFTKVLDAVKAGQIKNLDDIIRVRPVPNDKADFNDKMGSPVSLKLVNESADWPEGSPEVRAKIYDKARYQALGILWFLQNDAEVPEFLKKEVAEWGLPKDEYVDSGHWSPALYIREGRRMVGVRVFTEQFTQPDAAGVRAPAQATAIAIGDYSLNSHGVHRLPDGKLLGVISKQIRPWQVPFECLLPKDLDALLAPVALSASHVGYSAIRMEPTWTALGQAAGIAAGQAIKEKKNPRDLDVGKLQRRLHDVGAITFYTSDVPPKHPAFKAVQWFGNRGLFQDLIPASHATDWKLENLSKNNQWTKAFPHHAMEPDKPITAELAKLWIDRVTALGLKLTTDIPAADGEKPVSRGDFLRAMYRAVDAEYAPKPRNK
ncbi:FAD-dependent oxidoreductase [Humisphaera borealis]|uniref:FAD-dependent oxidoreductase n=1 Tax=Humisphaera borealis TaxID=2807512 RepID=A0A7M2WQK6_9BACT|nr:FAD-dependent oxidoreductase [Humisphaera borealis]QOV87825.1 FAD-dependent oxidoreductase [Humisphaera borealis]